MRGLGRVRAVVGFTLIAASVGCGPGGEAGSGEREAGADPAAGAADPGVALPAESMNAARAAADALTRDLLTRLRAEMEQGGALAGVEVCSQVAPRIAMDHSTEGRVVRRVSLKLRNPMNAPDAYERGVLERFAMLQDRGELPAEWAEVMPDGGGTLRYLRPIVIAQPCLACHGDPATIDPAVRAAIAERYPEDEAVGYRLGDLRGAVSVRSPADP